MNRSEWLKQRRNGIGASEASIIVGMSRWGSPLQLYMKKNGELDENQENEYMEWGNRLEHSIIQKFCEKNSKKVEQRKSQYEIKWSDEVPYLFCTVDGWIPKENAGVEAKTCNQYKSKEWEDGIPDEYAIQCQHSMFVTGADYWYLAVLIGGNCYKDFKLVRDDEFISKMLVQHENFWNEHVLKGVPPIVSASDDMVLMDDHPIAIEDSKKDLSNELLKHIVDIQNLKVTMDTLTKRKKEAENIIKKALGDFELGICGETVVSWSNFSQKRIDTKLLKDERPDIYDKYSKEINSRKFTIRS